MIQNKTNAAKLINVVTFLYILIVIIIHIQKVIDTVYAGKFPFEKYKGCAGVMQQYIFYYDLKGGKK